MDKARVKEGGGQKTMRHMGDVSHIIRILDCLLDFTRERASSQCHRSPKQTPIPTYAIPGAIVCSGGVCLTSLLLQTRARLEVHAR